MYTTKNIRTDHLIVIGENMDYLQTAYKIVLYKTV